MDSNAPPSYVRQLSGFTAQYEKTLLLKIAGRLPYWVTPNGLTLFGIFGAVLIASGYVASSATEHLLWIAVIGFAVHWFGDSLDGTLARVRKIERPRFGMFIDQAADLVSASIMLIGIGISNWARFDVAIATLATYFLLAVLVHLRAGLLGVYDVAHGGIGPTEGRLMMMAVTAGLMLQSAGNIIYVFGTLTVLDIILLVMTGWGIITFFSQVFSVGQLLAKQEPPSANHRKH